MNIYDKNLINYGVFKDSKSYKLQIMRYGNYCINYLITWYYEYENLGYIYLIDWHIEHFRKYKPKLKPKKVSFQVCDSNILESEITRKKLLKQTLKMLDNHRINYFDQIKIWKFIKKYTSYKNYDKKTNI